jgi:hypothetical protein
MPLAALLLSAAPVALAGPDIAGISASGAVAGRNGIYTGAQLEGWLDDGRLTNYWTTVPSSDSSTLPFFPSPIGTASGTAQVTHAQIAPGFASLTVGATVSAKGIESHPANIYTEADGLAYARDQLSAFYATDDLHEGAFYTTLYVNASLEGHIEAFDDAQVEVGAVMRLTDVFGHQFTNSQTWTYSSGSDLYFGHGPSGSAILDPLRLTVAGPTTISALDIGFNPNFATLEEFIYVCAIVGTNGGTGTALADFYSTMGVTDIELLDPNGQVIPNITVTGEDGDTYPYNASLPEPGFPLTACIGLAALMRRRRAAVRIAPAT